MFLRMTLMRRQTEWQQASELSRYLAWTVLPMENKRKQRKCKGSDGTMGDRNEAKCWNEISW